MTDCSLYLEALQKVFNEEFEKDMNELDQMEDHVFSVKHEKKMKKLIKRQKKPYFKLICTGGRRAACIIAAIIILSASALSVEAVRKAIFDFIISVFSDHNVITVEEGTDSGYPETIEEEYYISELPEGFVQLQYDKSPVSINSLYCKDKTCVFFYQTVKSKFNKYFDNEHSQVFETITYKEQIYLVSESNGLVIYIWDNEKYVFEIHSNLDKDFVLKLCNSTKIKV